MAKKAQGVAAAGKTAGSGKKKNAKPRPDEAAEKPDSEKPDSRILPGLDARIPDPVELSAAMANIGERASGLVNDFLRRNPAKGHLGMGGDPLNIGSAFLEMTARMMSNPSKLVEAQLSLWSDYMNLWQSATRRFWGAETSPLIAPERNDRRFKDAAWEENEVFDFIKQSYLLTARWMQSRVQDVEGMAPATARKVDFYTRQFVDALAPSNFILTNPAVLRETLESGGENLVRGLENLLEDMERGEGQLRISMTDSDAFEIGGNIAVAPGKVVAQTDLMQLIQYEPTTPETHKIPVMIVPPWINKYYILDLREKNSLVRWMVARGFTVFILSWVNPDEKLAKKTFEDYMREGVLAAVDNIAMITGEKRVNAAGYCLGGTLLATTLAYMAATDDDRIGSATFLATMVDFTEAGELSIFIDEEQLRSLEERMRERGFLDGAAMATTFNMLRANDLIWSFVVNNYLMGKEPFPFDLLYWNSDSTRMPAAMHSFYLREMYQENNLAKPGGIKFGGVPIDLTRIDIPVFILSTREDHIAPWKSTYLATQLYSGERKMVLTGSGHIAGVVNPPAPPKYGYWTSDELPADPDEWLDGAELREGSWWPAWADWIVPKSGPRIAARTPGCGKVKPIEDAPGSFVKVRAGS